MSIIGTPDFQSGTVEAEMLLATVPAATHSVTVTIPSNVRSLALAWTGLTQPSLITCTGVTTGLEYPGTMRSSSGLVNESNFYFFTVAPELDESVTIAVNGGVGATWYVFTQADVLAVDVPEVSLLLAIQNSSYSGDGVNVFFEGPGGLSMAPVVDSSGNVLTIDQVISLCVAARGAAVPADALLVGGTDGTDLRALSVDATGKLNVNTGGGSGAAAQALNAVLVANGYIALGSDGTDGRPLQTDTNGRAIPMVPTLTTDVANIPNVNTQVIAAPGSGKNYLFSYKVMNVSAAAQRAYLLIGGAAIAAPNIPAGVTIDIPLHGYPTSAAVLWRAAAVGVVQGLVLYAPGP